MIKNDRQYVITKAQLAKLTAALADSSSSGVVPGVDPRFADVHRRALESQIADLRSELEEHDALRSGAKAVIPVSSLADLPRALIQARIAAGLTQRALAERLGMPEQQIQRYEATEYESASLARLKDIAQALRVEIPSTIVPKDLAVSPRQFFRRVQQLGFDRDVVLTRILPADITEALNEQPRAVERAPAEAAHATSVVVRAGALVSRVLGIDINEFFSMSPLTLSAGSVGAVRFKRSATQRERQQFERLKGTEAIVDAYVVYAHYVALLLLGATPSGPKRDVPTNPNDVRGILEREYGGISLDAVLRFVWDLGIPVLPLSDRGTFHGACWRVDGRNVIVLKQRTNSLSRWIFDLLHELAHAGQHPHKGDFSIVEGGEEVDSSADEVQAMRFAGDVLLDGRAEEIARHAVKAASGKLERLKQVVPDVAKREGVSTDALANYLAYRLAQQGENWWGAANNLQRASGDPWRVARDILIERTDFSHLSPTDRQLLLGALRDP